MYDWLMNNKLLGKYLKNYIEKKGIPLRAKIISVSLIWITISYSIYSFVGYLHLKIFLCLGAIAITVHLIRFKTS